MTGSRRAEGIAIRRAALGCLLIAWAGPAAAQGAASGVVVSREASAPAQAPSSDDRVDEAGALGRVDRSLDEIERLIGDAYFRTALGVVATTRSWLAELPPQPGLALRQARLEVLAATAEVALGRSEQALGSMRHALAADPLLTLDEGLTSPKVLALLREARADSTPARTP